MSRILGLDLGPNSIGWALIENKEIINSGVRIFQEGINRNTTGSEVSKNKDRRDARGARRRNSRYKMRRDLLVKILKKHNLFPVTETDYVDYFKDNDPYELRNKGLSEKLELYELGRALFHINQRRGFKSNRKTASKEDGAIFKGSGHVHGIDEAKEKMKDNKYQTLGQYLASIDINDPEQRRRSRYTLRKWYKDEFDALWLKQQKYYPEQLTDQVKKEIEEIIFYQRKLKSQKHTIGYCTFEPKKRCSPKSSPVFQYFRILEQVNRIHVTDSSRVNEQLNPQEREILINKLKEAKEVKMDTLHKILGLEDDAVINLDLDKLLGNITGFEIKQIFGKDRYASMSEDYIYYIWHTIHFSNDDDWLKKYAKEKWNLDDKQIDRLMKTTMESGPNNGYGRLSNKAMKKLIPELETSLRYDEAALNAGYHHSKINDIEIQDYLDDPPNVRNPIVQQTMFQLKKVVNTIIQEHGQPDIIRVELARELKMPKDRREQIRIENIQRQRERDAIKIRLQNEMNNIDPGRDDVIKYLLWQESNEIDPYTGDRIGFTDLYNGEYEIEHIIPYSRSLDDSYANKTLCRKDYNLKKSNKTPFEAFGHLPEYEFMVERVKKFKTNGKRNGKLTKFQLQDVDKTLSEEFFHKQLNDTAYISREASKYLKQICPKVHVIKGGATAKLRYLWGLNDILSGDIKIKTRDDHRHHAIDALVIANTTQSMMRTLSTYQKYNLDARYVKASDHRFPMPWDHFHNHAEESVNNILVSFHKRNRPRGKLHEETNYGQITDPESGKAVYVVRKQIEALTPKMITNIVNSETRQLILERLHEKGIDTSGKFKIPKDAFTEPVMHPNTGNKIKSVRVKIPTSNMIQLYKDHKLFVEPGNNHHIEIFATRDGKKRTGYVITLFEAVQRKKQGLPIINKQPREEQYPEFVMSLEINDIFLVDTKPQDVDWENPDILSLTTKLYRIQKISKQITLRHHTISLSGEADPGVLRPNPNTITGIKIKINPLGKIEMCHD